MKEMKIMNKCTEKTGRWPDSLTDVSLDEVDAFVTHADVCRFHAEKLRGEDEGLRSVFRVARGLDGHGRILEGTELTNAIEEHERRHALWQGATRRMKLPFKGIYLTNCGEDIAGSGKFYDFRRYEGYHPLDLQSGLQIWGVLGNDGKTEEVLLGFYSLVGVRHTGKEELLPLYNGYTVGLRVEQLADGLFKVEFRCVEKEVLEKERSEVSNRRTSKTIAAAKTSGNENQFFGRAVFARAVAYCSLLIPSTRRIFGNGMAAGVVASCLLLAITDSYTLRHTKGDLPEMTHPGVDMNHGSVCVVQDRALSGATGKIGLHEIRGRVKIGQHRQSEHRGNLPHPRNRPGGLKPHDPDSTLPGETIAQNKVAMAGPVLTSRSNFGSPYKILDSKVVWYFQSLVGSSVAGDKRLVIHTGSDKALRDKLLAEIRQREFEVVPFNKISISSPMQVTARWGIIRQEDSVTVEVNLTANGESRFLSFCSDGTCPETTCEQAIRDAVSGVFAVINQSLMDGETSAYGD
jgi:hypothetical protein